MKPKFDWFMAAVIVGLAIAVITVAVSLGSKTWFIP